MRILLAAVVAMTLLSACRQDQSDSEIEELEFRVDERLLGPEERVAGLGVVFRPPVGWVALPADSIRQAAGALSGASSASDGARVVRIVGVYRASEDGAMLVVSAVGIDEGEDASAVIDGHGRSLRAAVGDSAFQEAAFRKGDLRFRQFLVQTEGRVIFELLAEAGAQEIPQFDYIIPAGSYGDRLAGLESSIGSIQKDRPMEGN